MADIIRTFRLPLLPLRNTVLFPNQVVPLAVGRPQSMAAVEAAAGSEEKLLALFSQKDDMVAEPGLGDIAPYGTLAIMNRVLRNDSGFELVVQGLERIRLLDVVRRDTYLDAHVTTSPVVAETGPEIEALYRTCVELTARILAMAGPVPVTAAALAGQVRDPLQLAYMAGMLLGMAPDQQQALLEAATLSEALQLAVNQLTNADQVLQLRQKIVSQAESEMDKGQKVQFLRQQLRAIQHELGDDQPEQVEVSHLTEQLEATPLPDTVLRRARRELAHLDPSASSYPERKAWLELLAALPWVRETRDILDLGEVERSMDADLYGLPTVKERLLEHVAVVGFNPAAPLPTLGLLGPVGTGKRAVARAFAAGLGRRLETVSLASPVDLLGSAGKGPGRILQAILRSGVKNPVILLEDVAQMDAETAATVGDILEVPELHDRYLGVPFDVSRVLFVLAAPTTTGIPEALVERLDAIALPGYSEDEKAEIARSHLLPRLLQSGGLSEEQVVLTPEAVFALIRGYTREIGVRSLERHLSRLLRYAALRLARGGANQVILDRRDVTAVLGPELPENPAEDLPVQFRTHS